MRTTLTIDDDVAAALDRLRRQGDGSLKRLVNEALRRGLHDMAAAPAKPRKGPFTRPVDLGPPLTNFDCIGQVLADLDAEKYR
jgi:glutamate mutase epsilon subunit